MRFRHLTASILDDLRCSNWHYSTNPGTSEPAHYRNLFTLDWGGGKGSDDKLEGAQIFDFECVPVDDVPTNTHVGFWYRKVARPSFDKLSQDVKKLGYTGTGKKYGVSDNAVRKWLKIYETQAQSKAITK